MEEKLHSELIEKIDNLKDFVKRFSLSSLLNTVAMEMRKNAFPDQENSKLVSPTKQSLYLIGIIQQSEEPAEPETLDKEATDALITNLNEIYQHYALIFWPSEDEKDQLTDEWHRCRDVAMPAFLHYFNTSLMASVGQITDRINDGLLKFDGEISSALGISVSNCLGICDAIAVVQQNKLHQFFHDAEKIEELRLELLDRAQNEGWSKEQFQKEAANSEHSSLIPDFFNRMDNLYVFSAEDLVVDHDELGLFLGAFSLSRGAGIEFTYITEENPAELRPIIHSEGHLYFCPSINALYTALLSQFEAILLNGSKRDKYLAHRDKLLEEKGEGLFLALLDEGAISYSGLCETKDLQYEHDTIIVSDRNLYLIEAKASPPIEPFRDPVKAYTRIKRHFHSDRGIQKGFEQADRVRSQLLNDGEVNLYDNESNLALILRSGDFDNISSICLTRDDFGPIATNLNLLLEKESDTPYPWVVNEFDLESLVQGYKHLEMGEDVLSEYLNDRIQLHGKLFGTDELEYAGFSLKHGGLKEVIEQKADLIFLSPDYSDIFDEIYLSEKEGKKVELNVTKPGMVDAREALFGNGYDSEQQSRVIVKRGSKRKRRSKRKITKLSRNKNRKK